MFVHSDKELSSLKISSGMNLSRGVFVRKASGSPCEWRDDSVFFDTPRRGVAVSPTRRLPDVGEGLEDPTIPDDSRVASMMSRALGITMDRLCRSHLASSQRPK